MKAEARVIALWRVAVILLLLANLWRAEELEEFVSNVESEVEQIGSVGDLETKLSDMKDDLEKIRSDVDEVHTELTYR